MTVIARYWRYHTREEEEFDTVDEAFSFLATHEDAGNISSGDVEDGDTVIKRGSPEHTKRLFKAWDELGK